ncbi:MAG: hypothetical protein IT379_14570 [Deltaproteobacteria bacterium]|nr:hypothetical protein [Deltaproteobacteria bacterium]
MRRAKVRVELSMQKTMLGLLACVVLSSVGCDVEDSTDAGRPDGFVLPDAGMSDGATDADGADVDSDVEACGESTEGNECSNDSICDDGCFCNGIERCQGGRCENGPAACVDAIECTMERCDEEANTCVHEPDDEMCQDDDLCNGTEQCSLVSGPGIDERGCGPGPELYCNDEDSCTIDSCDATAGCVHEPKDLDADGYGDFRCGGEDCDDDPRTGRDIHPESTEICDNRRDDDCDSRRDYLDTDCLPTNDDCDTVQMLPGAGIYSGSTRGLASDGSLGCSTISGSDAYFAIRITETSDLSVTAAGGTGGFGETLAVALRETCAMGPEIRCATGPGLGTVRQRSLEPGIYYIIVKTSVAAEFDLTVRITDPTVAPLVDVCDATTQDVSMGGTFTGTFDEVEDDYRIECNFATGLRDVAYRLTLTEPQDVTLRAQTTGDFTQTFLTLTTDCSTPSANLVCEIGDFFGFAEIRRRALPAGTYYILIESSDSASVSWSLDVTVTDPVPRAAGDACMPSLDITDRDQMVDISTFELDVGTSCGGADESFRDAIFEFTLAAPQDVILSVDHSFGAFIYLAVTPTMCGLTSGELRCRTGTTPMDTLFRALPAGRYFVVAATGSLSGTITARASLLPASMIPADDRCDGAAGIAVASTGGLGAIDVMGTTIGYEDNGMTRCGGPGRLDRYYQFTLTERRNIQAILVPDSPTATMTLELETTCGTTPAESTRCRTGSASSPPTITQDLDPGTYFLVVESPDSAAGSFTLTILSRAAT